MADNLDVYLGGTMIGQLSRHGQDIDFDYGEVLPEHWLSASMPATCRHHSGPVVSNWLDNLLPDNDAVRQRWATTLGVRNRAFDLLGRVGADCAGAVQVMPEGVRPDQGSSLEPVSIDDIADQIRQLRRDPDAWLRSGVLGHWSLAGAQGKFALTRRGNGQWFQPSGRAASTHILKVGVAGLPESDVAEFVTMRAARLLGLPVPSVEIMDFAGETAMVVTRFDRITADDGVRRVHQEDMCQALGVSRNNKYQADGGPSAGQIADLLVSLVDPRHRRDAVENFARAQVFNWLVMGTDAHAKNYALIYVGSRVLLAPFYDLTSAALLPGADVHAMHFADALAMKFGDEYRFRKVDRGRFSQAASQLHVDSGMLRDTALLYRDAIPDAVASAISLLPEAIAVRVRAPMCDQIAARVAQLVW